MLDVSELTNAVSGNLSHEEPDRDIIGRLRFDDALNVPLEMTDFDMWQNYMNDDLYAMDSKLREYFKKMRFVQNRNDGIRTAMPLVFAWIYGRPPTSSDSYACRMLHRLLEYYCTSYTGKSHINGRRFNRVYKFSKYATKNKRPYSLRLRLEEANEKGSGKPFVPYGTGKVKGPGGPVAKPRRRDRQDGEDADGQGRDDQRTHEPSGEDTV